MNADQNDSPVSPTNAIGQSLLAHAEEAEFSARRGVVGDLYPYIWQASKRMSARAISRFLEKEHGVKVSAVTVAKAIRSPKKYWLLFFDSIEPYARKAADAAGVDMKSLLFERDIFDHFCRSSEPPKHLEASGPDDYHEVLAEFSEAVEIVENKWYSLGPELIKAGRDYVETAIEQVDVPEEE